MTCFKLATGESLHHACKRLGLNYCVAVKWFDRGVNTADEALENTIRKRGDFGGKYFMPDGTSYYHWFKKNRKYSAYARFLHYAKKHDLETAVKISLGVEK